MAYFVQSFLLIIFPKFILVQILPTTQKNSQNHQESWPKWAPKWSIMKISSKVNKIWLISFQIFYLIYSRNLFSSKSYDLRTSKQKLPKNRQKWPCLGLKFLETWTKIEKSRADRHMHLSSQNQSNLSFSWPKKRARPRQKS